MRQCTPSITGTTDLPASHRPSIREPRWFKPDAGHSPAPPLVLDWLQDVGSLTRRVQGACHGRFWVEVLRQDRARPFASEVALLSVRHSSTALIREVQLHCDQGSWVYARTVIPMTSLRGSARRLTLLGSRPLGAVLFADPSVTRMKMEFARLLPGQVLFEAAVAGMTSRPQALWGRRTLFRLAGKPLLVNEIFLPALFGNADETTS